MKTNIDGGDESRVLARLRGKFEGNAVKDADGHILRASPAMKLVNQDAFCRV